MKKTELLNHAHKMLKDAGVPDFEESARRLLILATGIKDSDYFSLENVPDEKAKEFIDLVNKRCKHIPLDKLIGFKDFYGVRIPFDKNVLTPRYETEFLVDRIVMDIKNKYSQVRLNLPYRPITVLDLCTGSGCVGLAIANATGANVTMSDISKTALAIAKKNCELNNKIRKDKKEPPINPNFVLSDMFKNIEYSFDIIVCNPPYVRTQDLNKLEIEVRDFDPILALDGGKDGLDFYRTIAKEAHKYLNNSGTLYLEIGIGQAEKIVKMLRNHFDDVQVKQDLAGIDRFIIAKKRD